MIKMINKSSDKSNKSNQETQVREWLTVPEIAVELGRSPRTIRTWIAAKKLVASRVGGHYYVSRSDAHRLIQEEEQRRYRIARGWRKPK